MNPNKTYCFGSNPLAYTFCLVTALSCFKLANKTSQLYTSLISFACVYKIKLPHNDSVDRNLSCNSIYV